ncbi:BEACH domain-containing protein C2 [Frankliniella fusca]|uniref:BEACH domain-containing protein C2 n=1 Tax=Frankliniella fusca TaxID=407009 RepID=A0AAE1LGV1_9NEOP|nr:BEACH domain-containing protein C2 [Frankliniella fusca]KAK3918905.1 BEACH domain-containing protein C2 [Frankliniella fusca]
MSTCDGETFVPDNGVLLYSSRASRVILYWVHQALSRQQVGQIEIFPCEYPRV